MYWLYFKKLLKLEKILFNFLTNKAIIIKLYRYFKMKQLIITLLLLTTLHSNSQEVRQQNKESKKEIMIVYGSDSCHSCLDTKAFLKEKNIKFTYYDIDVNKVKEQEMLVKLQKANISTYTLSLPVIDNKGDLFLNKGNLKEFLIVLGKKIEENEN